MLRRVAELLVADLILWLAFNLSLYQYDKIKQLLKCKCSQPFPKRGMLSFPIKSFAHIPWWEWSEYLCPPPPPPNWYFEILMLHVMVFGVMRLTNILRNEIKALLKEAWGSSLAPSSIWGHREKLAVCKLNHALGFSVSGTLRNKFLFISHSTCCILLAVQTDGNICLCGPLLMSSVKACWPDLSYRLLLVAEKQKLQKKHQKERLRKKSQRQVSSEAKK